ncbi:MAG: type II secretion system protein GspG [Alphaproteobacteria bacterium]|nr:type II secretion system protein GspG [Alphaproteobacteria bacterium]
MRPTRYNNSKTLHNIRGFTLLEMLVVLVIIGLVASLVGPQLLGRVDSSRVTAADTQIRMLKGALDTFRLDVGRYPSAEEGLSLLMTAPSDERTQRKWQGPYLSEALPLDPWGNAYQYKPKNSTSVVLYSFGADGKAEGEGIDADVGFLDPNSP